MFGLNTITKPRPNQNRKKKTLNERNTNGAYKHNKSSPVSMSNDYKYGNFFGVFFQIRINAIYLNGK